MSTAVLDFDEMQQTAVDDAGALLTRGRRLQLASADPAGLRASGTAAWEKFSALPMPARTDENWRFASVKALDLAPYPRSRTI